MSTMTATTQNSIENAYNYLDTTLRTQRGFGNITIDGRVVTTEEEQQAHR